MSRKLLDVFTERGALRIKEFREEQVGKPEMRDQLFAPQIAAIRGNLKVDQYSARAPADTSR